MISNEAAAKAGVVLTRLVFPVWLLTGAVLKLVDASPSGLPVVLIKVLGAMGIDLLLVHQFSVSFEMALVGLVWLLPRLSRPLALMMLGVFFPILAGDLLLGASSCGCFGPVDVPPVVTLVLDLILFLGVLVLGRRAESLAFAPTLPTWPVVVALAWMVASFALGFGYPTSSAPPASAVTAGADPVQELPAYYLPEYTAWIGHQWSELDIAGWMTGTPDDLQEGLQYLLFYRKNCEHCHELMEIFFSGPLTVPTTVVAVPDKGGYPTEGLQPMPCTECRQAELPAGLDWFLQTPVLVRLNGGQVECAAEVDPSTPECLQW